MYYKPSTNQVFANHSAIRSAHENVLFPPVITPDMLTYNGIYPVRLTTPAVAPGKVAVPATPRMIDGVLTQVWGERDATPEELFIEAGSPDA